MPSTDSYASNQDQTKGETVRKVLIFASVVALAITSFAGTATAASPNARLPKSAADWATFTPAEKTAAYAWVNTHETKPISTRTISAQSVFTPSRTPALGVQPMATGLVGGGECGWSISNYSTGSRVAAWSQVHTNQVVYWLDTGMSGQDTSNPPQAYRDQLWRNGAQSYQTWGARAGAGANYVYASTSYDWKWFYENVHYTFQAWDSIKTSSSVFYWHNAYCVVNYDA